MIGQSNTSSGNGIWNKFIVRRQCLIDGDLENKDIRVSGVVDFTSQAVVELPSIKATDICCPGVDVLAAAGTTKNTPVDIDPFDPNWVVSSVTIVVPPATGGVVVNPMTGVMSYTPLLDFVGLDMYTYTILDDDVEPCLKTVIQHVQVLQDAVVPFLNNYLYDASLNIDTAPPIPGFVPTTIDVGYTFDVLSTNFVPGTFDPDPAELEITSVNPAYAFQTVPQPVYPDPDLVVDVVGGQIFLQATLSYANTYFFTGNGIEIFYRTKDTDGNLTNIASIGVYWNI